MWLRAPWSIVHARMLSEAGRISSGSADARVEAGALFDEADLFLDGEGETLVACRRAIARARDGRATILVAECTLQRRPTR